MRQGATVGKGTWGLGVLGGLFLAITVSACSQNLGPGPQLPSLASDGRVFLTKEQQAKAIADMTREKDAAKAEAERQIEKR